MKFSIIIRCKNEEKNLPDLLASIEAQWISDYEVVVVDNGSSDKTIEIARSYQDRISMQIISAPEATLGRLYSIGIQHAKGKYAIIIDADHVLTPGLLNEISEKTLTHDYIQIRESCYYDGWLGRIYDQEFELYTAWGCGYARVFPCKRYLEITSEVLDKTGIGEDHFISEELLPNRHLLILTEKSLKHKNIMSVFGLFKKHIAYGKTLGNLPSEKKFVWEKTKYFLSALPIALLRHPILTIGVFYLKFAKLFGLMLGRLSTRFLVL